MPCRREKPSARGFRIRDSRPGQHEDIRLISSVPAKTQVAPEGTLQRTVYLEARASAGRPTEFSITYELTTFAQHWTIDPGKVIRDRTRHAGAPHRSRRAPAAHRLHTGIARVLSTRRRRGTQSVSHRDETVRCRRSHSVGRCARVLDDHATSATTRCMRGTLTAASKRCC